MNRTHVMYKIGSWTAVNNSWITTWRGKLSVGIQVGLSFAPGHATMQQWHPVTFGDSWKVQAVRLYLTRYSKRRKKQHCDCFRKSFRKGILYGILSRWWFVSNIFGNFHPIPGEMIQFDEHIFQRGWNHQPVMGFEAAVPPPPPEAKTEGNRTRFSRAPQR